MKLFVCLFLAAVAGIVTYKVFAKKTTSKKLTSLNRHAVIIATLVVLFLVMCTFFATYLSALAPDAYCSKIHTTTSLPPKSLKTAQDFFDLGNYQYDLGRCQEAITSYTKAVQLDPNFTKAYNNRAYTNMRLHNYRDALTDLNIAIFQDPAYVAALMNRGDIYNYYYAINRQKAIADYNRVIALGKEKDLSKSVCGHKAMAETNNNIPLVLLKLVFNKGNCN